MRQNRGQRPFFALGILWLLLTVGLAAAPQLAPPHIVVTWETGSEQDTAGFNLYRSDSRQGPFRQLTAVPITARGSSSSGAAYKFTDRDVQPRATYRYLLEEVALDGTTTRHTDAIQSHRVSRAGGWWWPTTAVAALITLTFFALSLRSREPLRKF